MIFLPHTNTVILLEPYCGTITEPGLPVVRSDLDFNPRTISCDDEGRSIIIEAEVQGYVRHFCL